MCPVTLLEPPCDDHPFHVDGGWREEKDPPRIHELLCVRCGERDARPAA
jgi:hypothetical protein